MQGLGYRVPSKGVLGVRAQGLGCRSQGLGFRIQDPGGQG